MMMYMILELSIMRIIYDIDFTENQTINLIERCFFLLTILKNMFVDVLRYIH